MLSRGKAIIEISEAAGNREFSATLRDVQVANLVAYHAAKAGHKKEAEALISSRIARIIGSPHPRPARLEDGLFDLVLNKVALNIEGAASAEMQQLSKRYEDDPRAQIKIEIDGELESIRLTRRYAAQIDMERTLTAWRTGQFQAPPRSLAHTPLYREIQLRQMLGRDRVGRSFRIDRSYTLKRATHELLVWEDEGYPTRSDLVRELTDRFLACYLKMTFSGVSTAAAWLAALQAVPSNRTHHHYLQQAIEVANKASRSAVTAGLDSLIGESAIDVLPLTELLNIMVDGSHASEVVFIDMNKEAR